MELNNSQGLKCYKTQPNDSIYLNMFMFISLFSIT